MRKKDKPLTTIMHIVHLTPEEFDRVHYLRFRHPLPAIQRRMEIILLAAKSSMSYRQIAELGKPIFDSSRLIFRAMNL